MHHLESKQIIPATLQKAWDFFSDPANLSLITPPCMGFRIIRQSRGKAYPGMIIVYRVKPLLGIPLTWVTEITHVDENRYFVDEQRSGPYRIWHHQHHFREVSKGIEIFDEVDYALRFGFFGRLMNLLIIRRKLGSVFRYREQRIKQIFG